nr:thioesterase domain-containing protein [Ornithinibacillus scapharcae]
MRGGSVNNDGASSGLTVPNGKAQKMVMESALAACNIKPDEVSYLEAHGTGTPLGDPIEVGAITEVFQSENRVNPLMIGAVKGNIGHLESAAGVASVMKVVLSLYHKEIPPITNSDVPNPRINFEKIPAKLPREHTPWFVPEGKERIAGISSFGFSGTNAHIILSESPKKELPNHDRFPSYLLHLSAKDENALQELVARYDEYFQNHPEANIKDVCYVANACRPNYAHRAVFIGKHADDFRGRFKEYLARVGSDKSGDHNGNRINQIIESNIVNRSTFNELHNGQTYYAKINEQFPPKIAFIFGGNAEEILENAVDIYHMFSIFEEEFNRCLEYFEPYYGSGLMDAFLKKDYSDDKQDVKYMYLFVVEYAMMRLLESLGIKPEITFGERTGNYIAAVTAGVMNIETAVKLFVEAQKLTRKLDIKFSRVFAELEQVEEVLQGDMEGVYISGSYSQNEIIISGRASDLEKASLQFTKMGIETEQYEEFGMPSGLFETDIEAYGESISDDVFSKPKCRYVLANTGEALRSSKKLTVDDWKKNLTSTINYEKSLDSLYQQGYRHIVVIGDPTSSNGNKSLLFEKEDVVCIPLVSDGYNSFVELLQGLGKLLCLGSTINWNSYYQGFSYHKPVLPNYPFAKTKFWIAPPSLEELNMDTNISNTINPLKGKEIDLPYRQKQYSFIFNYQNLPELIDNSGVVHVGYYTEMLADTVNNLQDKVNYVVKDMEFISPMMIFENEVKEILLVLEDKNQVIEYQFHSKSKEQRSWNLHVKGTMTMDKKDVDITDTVAINAIKSNYQGNNSGESFYNILEQRGFRFGPSVQWVDEIWYQESEALIKIKNNAVKEEDYALSIHPGVIDSCAQVFNFVPIDSMSENKKFMISRLGDSTLKSIQRTESLYAYINVFQYDDEQGEIKGVIKLLDGSGKTLISLDGVVLKEFNEAYLGAMKELMEAAPASRTKEESSFLRRYEAADTEERLDMLTNYVREIFASIVEMEPEELDISTPMDEYGLDSMMGLQFHGKLTQLLDTSLSFVDLIQSTTITEVALTLTQFLPGGEEFAGQLKSKENNQAVDSIETWIYDYKPNAEAKVRIFCFPYGFGSADMYREWQERLGPEIEVCPIKLPGFDFERMNESISTDIDEFIDTLIDALGDVLTEKPCMTFGHSWGSLFAYRMAYKLSKISDVDFQKLFVSGYTSPVLPNTSLMEILSELKLLGIDHIPDFEEIKATASSDLVSKAFMRGWGIDEEAINDLLEGTKLTLPLIVSAYRIVERYVYDQSEEFHIPIVGFHGVDDERVLLDDMNAWDDITTESFKLYTMAGDHVFIDKSQSEERILEILKDEVDESIKMKR